MGDRDWGRFLERIALPKPAVIMAPSATDKEKASYIEAAERVEDGLVSVWPSGSSLTDFMGGSRGQDPFSAFIRHQEEKIVLLSTGGTLTSLAQADTGSLAGGAQMDVWHEIVRKDSVVVAQAVNGMVREYLARAFPGQPVAAEFTFDTGAKLTAQEAATVAATLKGAGWLVKQDELEKATGFTLEKAPETPVQGPFNGLPLMNKADTPFNLHDNPFKISRNDSDGQGDGSGLQELLGAFSRDLGPAAEEVKKLLADLDAGKDVSEAAAALVDRLPSLMPGDPEMAAVIAEEMARAFGDADGRARSPSEPVENTEDQPRGKTTEDTNAGSFAPADGVNVGTRDKAKAKAEKRQRQADNKATGISNMSTVESGADCHEFMQSHKLGRIAFYQGNDSEGYLHIKNNPDPDHQVMLKDGNIPNTLAYGKYYADTYQDKSGWIVVNGDKCVFLGKDGDGVKIITAYVSKSKAAVFARRAAIENKGV